MPNHKLTAEGAAELARNLRQEALSYLCAENADVGAVGEMLIVEKRINKHLTDAGMAPMTVFSHGLINDLAAQVEKTSGKSNEDPSA